MPILSGETNMDNNEIQDLKNQLALLQQRLDQLEVVGEPERASRRGMFKLAAGAAVGAVAGGLEHWIDSLWSSVL